MLTIDTSACCPECERGLDYENNKFICSHCKRIVKVEEIKFSMADLYELNILYTETKFNNRLEKLNDFCDKYNADFLGFDPFEEIGSNNYSGILDIGWENGFPNNLIPAIKELKRILR